MYQVGASSPSISLTFLTEMLKKNVVKVIGETAMRVDPNLTREEKFQVFCRVVDGLLDDGRITKAQHHSWTHIFG